MDANSSLITQIGAPGSLRDELTAVLTSFERATGLQICFRPLSDRWRDLDDLEIVPEPFSRHRSRFCDEVKVQSLAGCMKSDHADIPRDCAPPGGRVVEPFVRTCHAGGDEILLPLWSEGVLVAVLFAGQFTRVADNVRGPVALRYFSDEEVQHLRTLILAMRSYLLDVLRRLDQQRHQPPAGRRGAIENYIRESLSAGPTLAELATRLSISRSRASHAVREETGHTFSDLVEERRIAVARDLLASTDGTIAWVARQAGFNDVAYFCRHFKRKTGRTPSNFRKQYRRVVSV